MNYRIPLSWGPIDTTDKEALEAELKRLRGDIEAINREKGKSLFGDDWLNARDYQGWARTKVEWLKRLLTEDKSTPVLKAYCECCGEHQEVEIEPLRQDKNIPENGIWADVVCKVCRFVMLTFSANVEGDVRLVPLTESEGE